MVLHRFVQGHTRYENRCKPRCFRFDVEVDHGRGESARYPRGGLHLPTETRQEVLFGNQVRVHLFDRDQAAIGTDAE